MNKTLFLAFTLINLSTITPASDDKQSFAEQAENDSISDLSESCYSMSSLSSFQQSDINKKNSYGNSCIHEAILNKDFYQVQYLIDSDADLEQKNKYGYTPLLTAATKTQRSIIALLIAQKVNVQARDFNGKTALHLVFNNNNNLSLEARETIQLLLESGISIDVKDNDGCNVLHDAIYNLKHDLAKFAIELGINIKTKTNQGQSPLLLGYSKLHSNQKIACNNQEIIDLLIAKGANPFDIDNKSNTILHYMIYNLNYQSIQQALDFGININARNAQGRTPVYLAFLQHENNPSQRDKTSKLLTILLQKNADITIKDNQGKSMFDHKNLKNYMKKIPVLETRITTRNFDIQVSIHKARLPEYQQKESRRGAAMFNALYKDVFPQPSLLPRIIHAQESEFPLENNQAMFNKLAAEFALDHKSRFEQEDRLIKLCSIPLSLARAHQFANTKTSTPHGLHSLTMTLVAAKKFKSKQK